MLALGALVLALRSAPAADARSLFIASTALFSGGVGACVLGWRPRRQWVQLDDINLSRPWADGKTSLPLRTLSGIQALGSDAVVVSSTGGEQLRIDTELRGFQELLDELCDRIADNGYPETASVWREGQRQISIGAREVSVRTQAREAATQLGWSEIETLRMARDARRRLVPALGLRGGRELLLPYVGKQESLESYRALRQALRQTLRQRAA